MPLLVLYLSPALAGAESCCDSLVLSSGGMGDFYQVSRHAVDIYVDSEARVTLSRYLHRYSKYLHNIDSEARSRYQHRYSVDI